MKIRFATLSLLFLLTSCAANRAKSERPVADGAGAARSVVLCQTRLDELTALLGTPSRDGVIHTAHIVSWITATEPLVRYMAVLVNERGIVTDLYWNVPTEIVWNPDDHCAGRLQPRGSPDKRVGNAPFVASIQTVADRNTSNFL